MGVALRLSRRRPLSRLNERTSPGVTSPVLWGLTPSVLKSKQQSASKRGRKPKTVVDGNSRRQ